MIEVAPKITRQHLRVFLQDHFCGCGDPEAACGALHRILSIVGDGEKAGYIEFPKFLTDDGSKWLLLYLIDRMRPSLLEPGSGIEHSWLTREGRQVLQALTEESGDGFAALNGHHGCYHGFATDDESHDCGSWEDENPSWDGSDPKTWGWP